MTRYDERFFQHIGATSRQAAEVIAPLVFDLVRPRSVVDIGCGEGHWLAAFAELGVAEVLGVDGSHVRTDRLRIPPEAFVPVDLKLELPALGRTFDLALSLEVAEHLPEARAAPFVASVVALAPAVLFSAAIPFQGGTGHVNEQWPDYWQGLFADHGYRPLDCVRRAVWEDERVEHWYAQNTFLYVSDAGLESDERLAAVHSRGLSMPIRVVHPRMQLVWGEQRVRSLRFLARSLVRTMVERRR